MFLRDMSVEHEKFQSTLPARGATEYCQNDVIGLLISIHAPRTGSDMMLLAFWKQL